MKKNRGLFGNCPPGDAELFHSHRAELPGVAWSVGAGFFPRLRIMYMLKCAWKVATEDIKSFTFKKQTVDDWNVYGQE
jgi:hypothetical protein